MPFCKFGSECWTRWASGGDKHSTYHPPRAVFWLPTTLTSHSLHTRTALISQVLGMTRPDQSETSPSLTWERSTVCLSLELETMRGTGDEAFTFHFLSPASEQMFYCREYHWPFEDHSTVIVKTLDLHQWLPFLVVRGGHPGFSCQIDPGWRPNCHIGSGVQSLYLSESANVFCLEMHLIKFLIFTESERKELWNFRVTSVKKHTESK